MTLIHFFLNYAVNDVFWLDAVKLGDFIGKFDFIKTFIDGSLMWNDLEKLIPLFINNIRHKKPLPVYGKGENVRDWLFVEDHARAIDVIFHNGKIAETYNIGGFNEWKNIDIIKVVIKTVDRLLGREEGEDMNLITYVTDRLGHDARYAIDSTKLQKELGWEPSLQFEEGIEKTVRWYLDNQEWLDNITSGDYEKYYETMYKGKV